MSGGRLHLQGPARFVGRLDRGRKHQAGGGQWGCRLERRHPLEGKSDRPCSALLCRQCLQESSSSRPPSQVQIDQMASHPTVPGKDSRARMMIRQFKPVSRRGRTTISSSPRSKCPDSRTPATRLKADTAPNGMAGGSGGSGGGNSGASASGGPDPAQLAVAQGTGAQGLACRYQWVLPGLAPGGLGVGGELSDLAARRA